MTAPIAPEAPELDRLRAELEAVWKQPVVVAEAGPVRGAVAHAGSPRPTASSAARLVVAGNSVWVPAAEVAGEPACGLAPVYRYAGREFVLPTVRLLGAPAAEQANEDLYFQFLSAAGWLAHALTEWEFFLPGQGL